MTCQRPGCENDAAPRKQLGPVPKYCTDPECRRLRHNDASNKRYYREKGTVKPFRRKGPRKNRPKFAPGTTITPERSMSRPAENGAEGKKTAVVPDGKVSLVDRQAKLAGIDRGTREGFKRYMEERPVYFRWVFPGMTIAEAWGSVGGR